MSKIQKCNAVWPLLRRKFCIKFSFQMAWTLGNFIPSFLSDPKDSLRPQIASFRSFKSCTLFHCEKGFDLSYRLVFKEKCKSTSSKSRYIELLPNSTAHLVWLICFAIDRLVSRCWQAKSCDLCNLAQPDRLDSPYVNIKQYYNSADVWWRRISLSPLALHETSLQIKQHSFLSPTSSQNIARKVHNIFVV